MITQSLMRKKVKPPLQIHVPHCWLLSASQEERIEELKYTSNRKGLD